MKAQPYRWDLIPKIPRPMAAVLSAIGIQTGILNAPAGSRALTEVLGVPVRFAMGQIFAVRREDLSRFLGLVPRVSIVAQVAHSPVVVTCDALMALSLIRRLLGGCEEISPPRPLTLAEQGAAMFLALVFARAGVPPSYLPDGGGGSFGALRVHTVTQDLGVMREFLTDPWTVVLEAYAQVGGEVSTLHLLLPESFVMAAPPIRLENLERVESCTVTCAIEIGCGAIPQEEIDGLKEGDVVLLDSLNIHPVLGGMARLRCGGLVIPIRVDPGGEASVAEEPYEVPKRSRGNRLVPPQSLLAEEPDEIPRSNEGVMEEKETSEASRRRLAALEVEVVAEMGRITLSGRDIAGLSVGSVVRLERPVGGPVDLVVGGKLLARGELVDVEGEVGVRITELLA